MVFFSEVIAATPNDDENDDIDIVPGTPENIIRVSSPTVDLEDVLEQEHLGTDDNEDGEIDDPDYEPENELESSDISEEKCSTSRPNDYQTGDIDKNLPTTSMGVLKSKPKKQAKKQQ